MKILVTDDSQTTLAMLTHTLKEIGHEVITAMDAKTAIDLYKKEKPDLMILDVLMDKMNGFECAKKIREMDPDNWIPIIFLSSSVDDESIAKGIIAGGDDYITKPCTPLALEAKIMAMSRLAEMRKQLLETTAMLEKISSIDTLTGLYNRFQFEREIKEKVAFSERNKTKMALLYIDIDHFKLANDAYGHIIGDKLLNDIAMRIKNSVRANDFIARIGGDEFVVIISNIKSLNIIDKVAEKLVDNISKPYEIDNLPIKVSASVGIVVYPDENVKSSDLVRNADAAMYEVKSHGKNNYCYFNENIKLEKDKRISFENDIKFALDRNQLYINYQPIYNLISKEISGIEALARWKHPEFGEISPNIFIPFVEDSGHIIEIGEWIFMNACMHAMEWNINDSKDLKLSINVSYLQIIDNNFMNVIDRCINASGINPGKLEIELTESNLITFSPKLRERMLDIRNRGIEISVDDFGKRYSTITSLKDLPFSTLKIDKEFMKDVSTDHKNSTIAKTLIALGNNLGLKVIAEGIENESQKEFAILNGCIYGQGYLFSKPVSHEKVIELIRKKGVNVS